MGTGERMEILPKANAFVTLKDHKPRFANDLLCRLINPAKPEMGIISKQVLERMTQKVRELTSISLWKNTASVLDWFVKIKEKERMTFVCFDIVEFHPTVTEELLTRALSFAKQYANIDQREEDAIMHSRRSLLFSGERQWIKKKNSAFDVTMGSFDGAEVYELVGAFFLSELSQHIDQSSVGFYRDDGLAVVRDMSRSAADRLRKTIATVFQQHGLKITIDVNMREVDFLDVTLNLDTGKYKPFRKPNNTPLYKHEVEPSPNGTEKPP